MAEEQKDNQEQEDIEEKASKIAAEAQGISPQELKEKEANEAAQKAKLDMLVEEGKVQRGQGIDLIMDVSMDVSIELGRSMMSIKDILALSVGSVIELNKTAGEPVDILVNDKLIAKGEVVVIDDNFGVRVTNVVNAADQLGVGS